MAAMKVRLWEKLTPASEYRTTRVAAELRGSGVRSYFSHLPVLPNEQLRLVREFSGDGAKLMATTVREAY